jgi:hypothetical protein
VTRSETHELPLDTGDCPQIPWDVRPQATLAETSPVNSLQDIQPLVGFAGIQPASR